MKTIRKIFLITLLCSGKFLFAQDPSFSQFYFNKLYFNPAYCGLSKTLEVSLSHRVLWPNIPSKFNTEKFSADYDISCIPGLGGLGIIAISDVEGDGSLKTTTFGVPISSRVQITKKLILQAGVQFSILTKTIDWDKFVLSDQFDNVDGIVRPTNFNFPSESRKIFPDISFGLLGEYMNSPYRRSQRNKWSVRGGIAWHHVTQPDFSFTGIESKLPGKLTVHANSNIPLDFDESFVIAPAFVYEKQADMNTVFMGTNILWKYPFMGVWYRRYSNTDALAFVAGFKIGTTPRLYISYSYDVTLSKLASASHGSHEINLSYIGERSLCSLLSRGRKHHPSRKRIVPCPEF